MTLAIDFIKAQESCRLIAYPDSGGTWTIGWGATGSEISQHTVWTQEAADADLAKRVEKIVADNAKLILFALAPAQAAALASFEYNTGSLATSHLIQFVRKKNWLEAAKAFLAWDHVQGTENKGLLKRRLREAALFLEGC